MNDDELGLLLRGELHGRIIPPETAPEPLHEHLRHLRTMEPVRLAARRPAGWGGQLVRLAAVAAVCALVAAGLLLGGPLRNGSTAAGPSAAGPSSTFSFSPDPSAVDVTPKVDIIEGGARLDDKTGWVVVARPSGNRYVRVTQDGGATWSKPGEIGGNALDIVFLDASYGWMVSQSSSSGVALDGIVVSSTTDSGVTWHDVTIKAAQSGDDTVGPVSIHFRDRQHGVLLDVRQNAARRTCESYATSDGGKTWSGAAAAPCVVDAQWVDALHGYAGPIDSSGTYSPLYGMYLTSDGGQTWILVPSAPGCPNVYVTLPRADGSVREICGDSLSSIREMSSTDDGRTWKTVGAVQGLGSDGPWIGFVSDGQWIAHDSGSETFVASGDGGLTWAALDTAGLATMPTPREASILPGGWVIVDTMIICPDITLGSGTQSGGPCAVSGSALFSVGAGGATWTKLLAP